MTRPPAEVCVSRTRRQFLIESSLGCTALAIPSAVAADAKPKKIAAAVTVYTLNSHADVIVSRLFQGHGLDGKSARPNLDLISLYVDQTSEKDLSRTFAQRYGFRLSTTVADALTLGTGKLAVDGVLLIGEHGKYPENEKGQALYPRRRFFEETVKIFQQSGSVVPVFTDKHLAASWDDAKWMYDTAAKLKIPLMAGSSLPVLWRRPPLEIERGTKLTEIVAVSYHTLDGYGFHAMEMVQCLAERRGKGETGLAAVQCLEGPPVWKAGEQGRFDRRLLEAAITRLERKGYKDRIEDAVKTPVGFFLEYKDGLRATILTLNNAVGEWAVAWRADGKPEPQATLFWTQEARPMGHFRFLVEGIEKMFHTGKPTWPVERTLLTTGALDALLTSKQRGGTRIETPQLAIAYQPTFEWKEPPPSPPGRPFDQP